MIRAHFLSPEDRADLIDLARNGSAAHRLARRANALVLLDDGWSCENVARALLLDDDTIRGWHGLFVAEGLETRQPFEAFRNEQAVPPADRIVLQQQGPCNIFATPAIVQKHQRVRTPGQTMSGRSVPSQLDQVLPRFSVQKPGPYHPFGRIRIAPFGKGVLRILGESAYS